MRFRNRIFQVLTLLLASSITLVSQFIISQVYFLHLKIEMNKASLSRLVMVKITWMFLSSLNALEKAYK